MFVGKESLPRAEVFTIAIRGYRTSAKFIRTVTVLGIVLSWLIPFQQAVAEVAFSRQEGSLNITVDGKPFAVYVWNDPRTTRPYFKQVFAAGGEVQITRNHPPGPGDIPDHETFHPGIWWGFGDVGGNDYWRMKARVVGGNFIEEPKDGVDSGSFAVKDSLLVNGSDEVFCEQICRYTILRRMQGILLVCEMTLRREKDDFWLGDQEEMGLAVRVTKSIATVTGQGGRILSSDKSTDLNHIRTHQSDWCDYSGPVQEKFGGLMLMNDPRNFRKPWWHAVDTGLNIANPLGESELTGKGKKRQNVLVKANEPFRLCYGVLVHLSSSSESFDPKSAYEDFVTLLPSLEKKSDNRKISRADLPQVPEGFEVSIFAQEPMVYKPTSVCFDSQGRLFLGQGPQYPENYEPSPTDSVFVLIDSDQDGIADRAKEFAKGFNSVQGLAWRGNDLYVANSPELTVVRDLDGDDVADEYVVVFTDLGNREHALHGLNWAPDGKLYMSKGNSKGHNQPDKYGIVAPRPFRDLWDVEHPNGAPDSYPPKVFTKEDYRKSYHHWDDDWGREGGVLRCDPLGDNLEIVTRGLRNPWDMTMDPGFNWLGTDNDQSQGDRFAMPFYGAHFGWGHPYASHWSGDRNLPTVPVSGPMFPGSGAGIIYYDHELFPASHRQLFIVNDWLDGTFLYRPAWEGALMQPDGGVLEPFIRRGAGQILYRPTDIEFGPDGSIYICGWGGDYHYERDQEGSWIFRVTHSGSGNRQPWKPEGKRLQPITTWDFDQLIEDLGPDSLPVWRVAAQEELVRRGDSVREQLTGTIDAGRLNTSQQTWATWALGRIDLNDPAIDQFLVQSASPKQRFSLNLRLQAIRVLGHRAKANGSKTLPPVISEALVDTDPRVRFEAVQAIRQADATTFLEAVRDRIADENDRLVFYAAWGTIKQFLSVQDRKLLLKDSRPRVRLAALLSLQEEFQLSLDEALNLAENETDADVQSWAMAFAMNPQPPTKMPNTTARVELEQTVPAEDLIERARKAADRPLMRQLYLKLISRSSFKGKDRPLIESFYQSLNSDDERAMVLVPLTTSLDARELVWAAFGGEVPLQRSAVECWQRMLNLAARSSPSSEQRRKEIGFISDNSDQRSNVEANAEFLTSWLLDNLANTNPNDGRVQCAIEVLANTTLPANWKGPATVDTTLASIIDQNRDSQLRLNALTFVAKLDPANVPPASPLRDTFRQLCVQPDPRHYHALVAQTARLGIDVAIPQIEVATQEDVFARLEKADANRGRHLFHDVTVGMGCAACHRVSGKGNDFAPDLSGIGLRAKPETIVEAILKPSAAVTEGYGQQLIVTEEGLTITGVVLRETSTELTVFKTDRTQQTVPVSSIVDRQKMNVSAMPDGYGLYGNDQVADLAAYLMTLKFSGPATNSSESAATAN